MKDQVLETGVVDLSEMSVENKKKRKVLLDKESKKARRDIVEEPVLRKGPGSKERVEREFSRDERGEVLRTKNVLNGRGFDSNV